MCAHAGGLGAVKKIKAALRKSHSGPDLRNTDRARPRGPCGEREREREGDVCVLKTRHGSAPVSSILNRRERKRAREGDGVIIQERCSQAGWKRDKNGDGDGESVSQELKFIVHVCGRTWKKELDEAD